MTTLTLSEEQRDLLNAAFNRSYYSAAGYVYESRPYLVPEDRSLIDDLKALRLDDRRHAMLLAQLIETYDEVPQPGTFAYWYRDVNYLTLPTMLGFVAEAMQDDLAVLDRVSAAFGPEHRLLHTTLRTVRQEKDRRLQLLLPLAAEAIEREARAYAEGSAAIRNARQAREAKAKAAKAGAKGKPAAARRSLHDVTIDEAKATAGLADPFEAGISMRERTKRKIARLVAVRAAKRKAAGADVPDAVEVDWRTVVVDEAAIQAALPDPAEAGLSPRERTARKIARLKAVKDAKKAKAKGGGSPGAAAKPAPAAASGDLSPAALGVPDPDEPGIPPKEKAKRKIAYNRAKKEAEAGAASAPAAADSVSAAPAAPAASSGAKDLSPAALGVLDPDEPGISPKEQGRRRVLYNRARKQAEG